MAGTSQSGTVNKELAQGIGSLSMLGDGAREYKQLTCIILKLSSHRESRDVEKLC